MKFDFTYDNPTRIHFGKTAMDHLEEELKHYGPNILLAYGGGSIIKIGLYDQVKKILEKAGKNIFELPGIMPNPTYTKMLEGSKMVEDYAIDLILAVGGGSVIDCAKGISAGAYCKGDPWQMYWMKGQPVTHKITPLASILTMVGTGSEMNGGSVITHEDQKIKTGHVFEPALYPRFSILNPEFTFSVPDYQMKSGIFDMLSHLMEQYFGGHDDNVSDYVLEGLMRSVIHSTPIAVKNPHDYEARSNLMWASTLALNTISGIGKSQDWEVHAIEHQLSALTNCAHGMGLAAISVPYYRYIYPYGLDQFVRFAQNVWQVNPEGKTAVAVAKEGIDRLAAFIRDNGMVTALRDLGATPEMLPLIAESSYTGGRYRRLTHAEILAVLRAAY